MLQPLPDNLNEYEDYSQFMLYKNSMETKCFCIFYCLHLVFYSLFVVYLQILTKGTFSKLLKPVLVYIDLMMISQEPELFSSSKLDWNVFGAVVLHNEDSEQIHDQVL